MSADLAQYTDTDAGHHWTARRILAHVLEGRLGSGKVGGI